MCKVDTKLCMHTKRNLDRAALHGGCLYDDQILAECAIYCPGT